MKLVFFVVVGMECIGKWERGMSECNNGFVEIEDGDYELGFNVSVWLLKIVFLKRSETKKGVKLVMKLSTSGMSQQGNEGIIFFSLLS